MVNQPSSWNRTAIAIHWLTSVAVIGLFSVGWWMVDLDYYSKWYRTAPDLHKSIGLTLLALTLFRIIWRMTHQSPAALASHSNPERLLAHLVHIALYGLLLLVMIAGYLISTADGRSISVFGLFEVPATITTIPNQAYIAGDIHFYAAVTLMCLAGLHALAALKHHVIDKDNTLKRMVKLK